MRFGQGVNAAVTSATYDEDPTTAAKRPCAWIEPKGLGQGLIDLVEIPTADETNDNIVAFGAWLLCQNLAVEFAYRLHWTWTKAHPEGARAC